MTSMNITEQAMRILAVLCEGKPGGEIKIHRETLDALDPATKLECFTDGPIVVVRVSSGEQKP